jgi:secreted PhoX family phosphatase
MSKYPPIDNSGTEIPSNHSANPHITDLISRRTLLQGSLSLAVSAFLPGRLYAAVAPAAKSRLGFEAIAASRADAVQVPPGYTAKPFLPWGTPILKGAPAFRADASNSGRDQEQQMGSHHDGMHFFPMDAKREAQNSSEGLLVMNHEYVSPLLLHRSGPIVGATRPTDQVHKELAAHGVSVVHIRQNAQSEWQLIQDSPFNRRITGMTLMDIRGPVRGHAKVQTRFSPAGHQTRGTLSNCAHGVTPWHTYLAAEENWAGYFTNRDANPPREHKRYGVSGISRYRWESADSHNSLYQRFDASSLGKTPQEDFRNEPNCFGWVVEIDPFDPVSVPQKRTALGRFAREGIVFAPVVEGKPLVCYSGDDAQNEYLYKFVSAEPYVKATAGGHLLDKGTLYVAQFSDKGTGRWLPLDVNDKEFIQKAEKAGVVFADQADLLLNTRLAADIAGATKMDRPEWGAVDPHTGEVYFSLTGNESRSPLDVDAANPRPYNTFGHIIRWRPQKNDHTSREFTWDIFLFGGTSNQLQDAKGKKKAQGTGGDTQFSNPDGLWFDPRGLLWIQTDIYGSQLAATFGNNQMLVADPRTREIKRFLVGPVDCEITGAVMTPDMRTLFVNIQHPGERSRPGHYTSNWPDGGNSRPRSATVIVQREDGGIIGSAEPAPAVPAPKK